MTYRISRQALYRQLQDLLRNIHDYDRLQKHSLADVFFPDLSPQDPNRAHHLRRFVLRAMEKLGPVGDVAPQSTEWVRYHILTAHYLEGRSVDELLAELVISERQFYREQRQALQSLVGMLWERSQAMRVRGPQSLEKRSDASSDLSAEVERLLSYREMVDLEGIVSGVLDTVKPLVDRVVPISCQADRDLPPVMASRTVVRQLLIHLLGRCIAQPETERVEIHLTGGNGSITIEVRVVQGGHAFCNIDETLSLEEVYSCLATAGGTWQGLQMDPRGYAFAFLLPSGLRRVILTIENNPGAILLLQRYLAPYGYEVVGVGTGAEALELFEELSPAMIMLDIMLPQQDGWEVLRALKASPATRNVPVLICSVLDERELASALGAEGYLRKPFSQAQLVDSLSTLLRGS